MFLSLTHRNFLQSSRLVRERKRVAWILLSLALLFALCWLPHHIALLVGDLKHEVDRETAKYLLLLGHSNSAINPIIYCLMSRNFRRSVKDLFFRRTILRNSRTENLRIQVGNVPIRPIFRDISLASRFKCRMQWMFTTSLVTRFPSKILD